MSAPREPPEEGASAGESAPGEPSRRPGRRFALVLVTGLGVWKVYEAFAAETMRATLPPSLYAAGLAGFGASLLGPRRLRLVAFFAGAALCLAAIALET